MEADLRSFQVGQKIKYNETATGFRVSVVDPGQGDCTVEEVGQGYLVLVEDEDETRVQLPAFLIRQVDAPAVAAESADDTPLQPAETVTTQWVQDSANTEGVEEPAEPAVAADDTHLDQPAETATTAWVEESASAEEVEEPAVAAADGVENPAVPDEVDEPVVATAEKVSEPAVAAAEEVDPPALSIDPLKHEAA